jgi:hypothetical protein
MKDVGLVSARQILSAFTARSFSPEILIVRPLFIPIDPSDNRT